MRIEPMRPVDASVYVDPPGRRARFTWSDLVAIVSGVVAGTVFRGDLTSVLLAGVGVWAAIALPTWLVRRRRARRAVPGTSA